MSTAPEAREAIGSLQLMHSGCLSSQHRAVLYGNPPEVQRGLIYSSCWPALTEAAHAECPSPKTSRFSSNGEYWAHNTLQADTFLGVFVVVEQAVQGDTDHITPSLRSRRAGCHLCISQEEVAVCLVLTQSNCWECGWSVHLSWMV